MIWQSWQPVFEEHGFPLPKIKPTTYSSWISTFETERILKDSVNRLMEILEDPQVEDLEDISQYLINKNKDTFGLLFYVNDVPLLEVFADIEGIDINQLLLMVNDYIMRKLTGVDIDGLAYVEISYRNDIYHLEISDGHFITKTNIARDTVKLIFYRVLSYGKIPYDNIYCGMIKLVK